MQNDNKRRLVMFRPLGKGDTATGYAKLDLGNGRLGIQMNVQGLGASGGKAYGLLLGSDNTALLGSMELNVRGQGSLRSELPLNNVGGVPFTKYGALAVARDFGDRARISLVGNIGNDSWIDYSKAEQAVMEILHPQPAKAVVETSEEEAVAAFMEGQKYTPETGFVEQVEETKQEPAPAPQMQPVEPNIQPADEEEQAAEIEETEEEKIEEIELEPLEVQEVQTIEEVEIQPAEPSPQEMAGEGMQPPVLGDEGILQRIEREAQSAAPKETLIGLPALLAAVFWPQALWALSDLFARYPLDENCSKEDEVYIRVPVDEAHGHVILGARIDDGWVTMAGYGVPCAFGDPRPGFEEGEYLSGQDGSGYYVLWEAAK